VMALTGIAMAWARVYVGVHFPLDMLGALVVAMFSAWLSWRMAPLYMPAAYTLAQRVHQYLFGALIRRGWVRE
jgi:undecaprenyl-diphosphatase